MPKINRPDENISAFAQDSDAQGYTLSKLLAYIYQAGIPEWDAREEYYINSVAIYLGRIYLSLIDNNVNFQPDASWGQWKVYIPDASESVKGVAELATLSDARNGVNLPKIMTPALVRVASSGGLIETRENVATKIWTGTEEQYNAITIKDPNTLYFCTAGTALAKVFLGGDVTEHPAPKPEPITADVTNSSFHVPGGYVTCMWNIEYNTDGNEFDITISRNNSPKIEYTTCGSHGTESDSFDIVAGDIISSRTSDFSGLGSLAVRITLS